MDSNNVRVAVTGELSVADHGAVAPSGTGEDITNRYTPLGYCDESGVVLSLPGAGDVTTLKAWQNSESVRILRSASEDPPTIAVSFIETKLSVVEFVFGVTVTQTSEEGVFEYTPKPRDPKSLVLDVVDGDELFRIHVPSGVVTEMDAITFVSTDAIKFGCTIGCDMDGEAGYNFKSWMTSLRSA